MSIENLVYSPVDGKLIPLQDVQDGVFSERMLGDGVAVIPCDDHFYAPITGEVMTLFPTGHAFGIRGDNGVEILVHIGIDTVEIEESVFRVCCKQGDRVSKGDLMVVANLDKIVTLGYSNYTMIIQTDKQYMVHATEIKQSVHHGEVILTLTDKNK